MRARGVTQVRKTDEGDDMAVSGIDLSATKVLVTGAGSGIGAGIAQALARSGAAVAVNDLDGARANETVQAIGADGGTAHAVAGDVSTRDGAQQVVDAAVAALGGLNALCNNVGLVRGGALESLSEADWDLTFKVDVYAGFFCSQAAFPALSASGGAIVNTSSLVAVVPAPFAGAYNAAKAAVSSLTQHMAVEWGPKGIRANAVLPGLIPGTRLTPGGGGDEGTRARRGEVVPLGRVGTPDDVASVILFLLSDYARYVTGQLICVDGGLGLAMQTMLPS
jgi:NAD(P)-dependent dehydrogenase (short-subunit alcohol dehydrogenase family)